MKVNATVPGVGHVNYVMAVEHPGGPVGWESQIFVTSASTPLTGWTVLNGSVAPVACPCIRYIAATKTFYVMGAGGFSHNFQAVAVKRSKDLRTWQAAKYYLVKPNATSKDATPFDGSSIGMYKWDPSGASRGGSHGESRYFNVSTLLANAKEWDHSAADPVLRTPAVCGFRK